MKKLLVIFAAVALTMSVSSLAQAESISFTANSVKSLMSSYGDPLSDASNQWGLWAVRVMPVVGGTGGYTITSTSTTQSGWGSQLGVFGQAPYAAGNHAWFYDISGAEVPGNPANPLYMIMNQPASYFQSYTFDNTGTAVGAVPPDSIVPPQSGGGGTNVVTAVGDSSTFKFDFTLDPSANWDGLWQFVVDGSKYTLGTGSTAGTVGKWQANFFGGYGNGGGLSSNVGDGYVTPEPSTMLLLGVGLVGLAGIGRKKFFK